MPHPRNLPLDLSILVRNDVKRLNVEMQKTLHKLLLKEHGCHNHELVYLFDDSTEIILQRLEDGDTLIIHGEGFPFLLGPSLYRSSFTLTAGELAALLHQAHLPVDRHIVINLLSCNSATLFEGRTYAQDLSAVLHYLYKYKNLLVGGYNGYVVVKNNGKFSASTSIRSTKGSHANIDDAYASYCNGCVRDAPGRVLISDMDSYANANSDPDDSWAMYYINKTSALREEIERLKMKRKTH